MQLPIESTNLALDTYKNNKYQNLSQNINEMKDNIALKKATDDFEAFFLQKILETSLKDSSIAGEGTGSDIIKGMYIESLAKQSTGTLGISTMLFDFLTRNKKG